MSDQRQIEAAEINYGRTIISIGSSEAIMNRIERKVFEKPSTFSFIKAIILGRAIGELTKIFDTGSSAPVKIGMKRSRIKQ
ncbi:MAG: hypothetical protein ACHQYP_06270 [Nitrospiria bacterium]